jgi:hypothetical protein
VRVSDVTDKVISRQRRKVDRFGGITADVPLPAGASLGNYSIAILHGDDSASGGFEVQEYRKPEFEVRVTPGTRFIVQDDEVHVTINARYYFGQPVAGGRIAWVAHRQPYYSPYRWMEEDGEDEEGGGGYWYGDRRSAAGQRAARRQRHGRDYGAGRARRERQRLQPPDRGARRRRQQPRGERLVGGERDVRRVPAGGQSGAVRHRHEASRRCSASARWTTSARRSRASRSR